MSEPVLVIMAAGIGSRYGGLKQLESIGLNNEIIVDYSIYDAIEAGFKNILFIIRKDIEQIFKEKIGDKLNKIVNVDYVFQELEYLPPGFNLPADRTKPWGTGHAILCCKEKIKGPFAVINADDFYGKNAFKYLYSYLKETSNDEYCLIGYELNNTLSAYGYVTRGVCKVTEKNYLEEIIERFKIQKFNNIIKYHESNDEWKEVSGTATVSMNMWGFTDNLFKMLEDKFIMFLKEKIEIPKSEFLIPVIIGELLAEDKIKVKILKTNDKWMGITYKEDLKIVKSEMIKLIDKKLYPEKLF